MNKISAFEDRFIPEPNSGCWLWLGMIQSSKGYGWFCFKQKTVRAHRASWEIYNGPIPDALHVLHKCDVRCCVNPDHLFLGTHLDNMRDRHLKGRSTGPKGESSPRSKLTCQEVLTIRRLTGAGGSPREIADQYGVRKGTVYDIINRKTWTHV